MNDRLKSNLKYQLKKNKLGIIAIVIILILQLPLP